jgi:hypothetical protein
MALTTGPCENPLAGWGSEKLCITSTEWKIGNCLPNLLRCDKKLVLPSKYRPSLQV